MKIRLTRILHNKAVITMLSLAMFVLGVFLWGAKTDTVQAAVHMTSDVLQSTQEDYYFMTFTGDQVSTYLGKKAPTCDKSGYIFAGWFTQEVCNTKESLRQNALYKNSVIDPAETYYAKFVAEDVLSVRVQVSNEEDVNPSKEGKQKYMRLVSSVEAVGYATVGFQVKYEEIKTDASGNPITDENGAPVTEWKYKRNSSQLVYKRVDSTVYANNPAYSFSPKVMDTESEFFITSTWKGPDNNGIEDFDKYYCVRAFWNTFDGLTMAGTFRYVCVNDGLNTNIVNLTIKDPNKDYMDECENKEELNVAYDNVDVPYKSLLDGVTNSTATATVIYHDGTYAYMRIDLREGVNRAMATHSATWFTLSDNESVVKEVLWRNLYSTHENIRRSDSYVEGGDTLKTSYKDSRHHEDHTWYDIYSAYENAKDGSKTEKNTNEYVIASSADLYGLAEMSHENRKKFYDAAQESGGDVVNFDGMTVYFCNDITINEGTATWTEAVGDSQPTAAWEPAEGEVTYQWYAIDMFAGTLDGQDHVISGLYATSDWDLKNMTPYYFTRGVGFMTRTQGSALVRNFNIVNSFYASNYNGTGGVVAIGNGTIENVYTDVQIDADTIRLPNDGNRGYGRSGGIVGVINKTNSGLTVKNCWSSSNIVASNAYLGGILGNTNDEVTVIQHCLYTGEIYYASGTNAHAGGILGKASSEETYPGMVTIQDSLSIGTISVPAAVNSRSGNIIGSIGNGSDLTYNNLVMENTYGIFNTGRANGQQLEPIGWLADIVSGNTTLTQPQGVCYAKDTLQGIDVYTSLDLTFGAESDGYYWTVRSDDTPLLTYFIGDSDNVVDMEDLEVCPFVVQLVDGEYVGTIDCLDQLLSFRRQQNSGLLDATYPGGVTVKLVNNITINEGDAVQWSVGNGTPSQPWTPIANFKGTFEGQGYKISGLYGRQGSGQTGCGLFTLTNGATIQNLTIDNCYIEANTGNGTGALVGCGSGTFKTIHVDAIFIDTTVASRLTSDASCHRMGGIIGKTTGDVTIEDSWFSGSIDSGYQYIGGLVGQATAGKLTIKHCLNTGTLTHHYSELSPKAMPSGTICWGGIVGYTGSAVSVVIDDVFAYGAVSTLAQTEASAQNKTIDAATRVGMVAGSIAAVANDNTSTYSVTNTFATDRAYVGTDGSTSTDYVATSTRTMIDNITSLDKMLTSTQSKQYMPFFYTTLDLRIYEDSTNYWVARHQNVPMLVSFLDDELDTKNYLVNYYPEQYRAYNGKAYIFHAAQLTDLANNHPNVASTVKVYLMQDIVMNEGDATTWGSGFSGTKLNAIQGFKGTFDGQGHTISGIYGTRKAGVLGTGLFTETTASTVIQNLNIENSYFQVADNNGTAAIAGRGGGTFRNIYAEAIIHDTITANSSGGSLIGTAARLGGIMGHATGTVTIDNCWSNCTITSDARHTLGGILGEASTYTATIKNSLFTGSLTVGSQCSSNNVYAGGILGLAGDTTSKNPVLVQDCFSSGFVKSHSATGIHAIGGLIGAGFSYVDTTTSTATSYVTADKSYSVRHYLDTEQATDATITAVSEGALGILNGNTATQVTITLINGLNTVKAEALPRYIGALATTNAEHLDYTNYWTIVTDSTPMLKYFAK